MFRTLPGVSDSLVTLSDRSECFLTSFMFDVAAQNNVRNLDFDNVLFQACFGHGWSLKLLFRTLRNVSDSLVTLSDRSEHAFKKIFFDKKPGPYCSNLDFDQVFFQMAFGHGWSLESLYCTLRDVSDSRVTLSDGSEHILKNFMLDPSLIKTLKMTILKRCCFGCIEATDSP
jgi:hypothetical protein